MASVFFVFETGEMVGGANLLVNRRVLLLGIVAVVLRLRHRQISGRRKSEADSFPGMMGLGTWWGEGGHHHLGDDHSSHHPAGHNSGNSGHDGGCSGGGCGGGGGDAG